MLGVYAPQICTVVNRKNFNKDPKLKLIVSPVHAEYNADVKCITPYIFWVFYELQAFYYKFWMFLCLGHPNRLNLN